MQTAETGNKWREKWGRLGGEKNQTTDVVVDYVYQGAASHFEHVSSYFA